MYQGKFDKKKKNSGVSSHDIVASRNKAAAAPQPARQSAPQTSRQPVSQQPVRQTPAQQPARQAAPQQTRRPAAPASQQAPAKRQAAPAAASKQAYRQAPQPEVQVAPQKRGPRLGGVIFYTLYFLFIFLFFVATFFGMKWFQGWLSDYEAAQPTTKSQEVFEDIFANPDWAALYDAAGVEDTQFENKDVFVTYMETMVDETPLTYQETSNGLSQDMKYFVKLGDSKLAYFTLVPDGDPDSLTIVNWELGEVVLFFERNESVRIQKQEGHTVYINGVALNEDYTVQRSTTRASTMDFLPDGVTVPGTCIQEISGLLMTPTVTITDENNNQMEVFYDEEQDMFIELTQANSISEEEQNVALQAIKVYAAYQIKEASATKLDDYFLSSGDAYKSILKTVLDWTKGNRGYTFSDDSVTNYVRYSDKMFSAYVSTTMTINLTDGGVTEKPIHATLLFEKINGSWKVTKMTNADIGEPVDRVRLTFMHDTTVLSSEFYDTDVTVLEAPMVSAPEGKQFAGWVQEFITDSGSRSLRLVFTADENGVITISNDTVLEPMTLIAYFEDVSSAAEGE